MKPAVFHLQAAYSNSVQTRRVIKWLQGAGVCVRCMGWLWVPTGFHRCACTFAGPPRPYPPLQSCQFQREKPVTEANCKDTFTLITYVFTELTKLPNQLLCWALKLCVSMCAHMCAHSFFPYRCCFPHARKTWYSCCIVIFLSHRSILWLHLFQVSPSKHRKKGISKYIQLRNYFWVK